MNYPICVSCKNYAYWDGDFCCAKDMKVLQYGDCLNEDAFDGFPKECENFDKETNKKLINLRKDVMETVIKENNGEIITG